MVYDITSPSSFKNLQDQWLPEIKEKNPNAIRLVVGNKQGEQENQKKHSVTTEEIKQKEKRKKKQRKKKIFFTFNFFFFRLSPSS